MEIFCFGALVIWNSCEVDKLGLVTVSVVDIILKPDCAFFLSGNIGHSCCGLLMVLLWKYCGVVHFGMACFFFCDCW